MAVKVKQQYGIAYPFTTDSNTGYFLDTNTNIKRKVRSIVMHIIFTPKGQKIRDPQFGTDLIRHIFEPNEEETWSKLQDSVRNAIRDFLPYVSLTNIEMLKNEDDASEVFIKIQYTIDRNGMIETDSVIAAL